MRQAFLLCVFAFVLVLFVLSRWGFLLGSRPTARQEKKTARDPTNPPMSTATQPTVLPSLGANGIVHARSPCLASVSLFLFFCRRFSFRQEELQLVLDETTVARFEKADARLTATGGRGRADRRDPLWGQKFFRGEGVPYYSSVSLFRAGEESAGRGESTCSCCVFVGFWSGGGTGGGGGAGGLLHGR